MLADRRPAPPLTSTSGFFAPHVDKGSIVAGSASAAAALLAAVQHEMSAVRFVFHEVVEPTQKLDLLGRTLDLEARAIRPSQRRLWQPWLAVDEVARRPFLSRDQLRVVLGHLVDTLRLRRELLSVLCLAYAIVGKGGDAVVRLPSGVREALEVCRDVLLLIGLH